METNFVGQAYQSRSDIVGCNTLVNMYAEREPSDAKNQGALRQAQGMVSYAQAPSSGEVRGMLSSSVGTGYAAIGRKVYTVTDGLLAPVKSVSSPATDFEMDRSTGFVSMREDGTRLIIVDGVAGYAITISSNLMEKITDPEFPNGCTTIAWVDGYFIAGKPETQQYYISTDGITWEPLDFASAEANPDFILGVIESHREVKLLGASTIETVVNSGAEEFPFTRPGGAVVDHGVAGPFAISRVNNTVCFLAQGENGHGSVFQITGLSSAARISTHAIEYAISQWPIMDDAFAFSFHDEGHSFFVLTSPSANETWVYDFATGVWHRRGELVDGAWQRMRANCYMLHENKHLVGDFENGQIYEMTLTANDLAGNELVRERTWRMPNSEMRDVRYHRLTIDCEMGVGLDGGVFGEDPVAMLHWSNDGGKTWTGYQQQPIRRIGVYLGRVSFRSLGMARDRVFRLRVSDPVPFNAVGAYVEAQVQRG